MNYYDEEFNEGFENIKEKAIKVKNYTKKTVDGGKKVLAVFKKTVMGLYTPNEKELLNNRPALNKVISRGFLIIGAYTATGICNPVVGLISAITAYYTDQYIAKKVTDKEKKKLYDLYIKKINILENKINNSSNDLEKQKYESLKKSIYKNAKKLKVYDSSEGDE